MNTKREKRELIERLKLKWQQRLATPFPDLPPMESDLRKPVGDLIMQDTFVAGCIQRIIDHGTVDDNLAPLLIVDQSLTDRIASAKDVRSGEFLQYKAKLDECISIAHAVLKM